MTNTLIAPPGFPLTLSERSLAPDDLRAKISYEDYLDFAEICPCNVEYFNGEIADSVQVLSRSVSLAAIYKKIKFA